MTNINKTNEIEKDNSMVPKAPTGTKMSRKGKNLIVFTFAGIGAYILWAIFGLSPKAPSQTAPQDSVSIGSSELNNQQEQGQTLVSQLRTQAYGGTGANLSGAIGNTQSLPIPQGAAGQMAAPMNANNGASLSTLAPQGSNGNIPSNVAGLTGGNAGYASSANNQQGGGGYYGNSGQGQDPRQQALQNGMQSSLTPDGFQSSGSSTGNSNNANSNNNSNNQASAMNNGAMQADQAAISQLASSGQNNQNMQGEKNTFLQSQNGGNDTLQGGVVTPSSNDMIMAGSIIPATLITGIDSDLPGQIQAIVSQNIYDSKSGNDILIPQGSKLLGTYDSQVAYGQSRVLIVWTRVIFPNDQYIDLQGMPGADLTGFAGLTDQVNNHYFRIYGSALLMSLFSAGMQLSQPQSSSVNGAPTNQQIIAGAMGQELGQVSTQMIQQNLNIQPTLNIRPGENFNVLVTRDIPFNGPYNDNAQPQILLSQQTN